MNRPELIQFAERHLDTPADAVGPLAHHVRVAQLRGEVRSAITQLEAGDSASARRTLAQARRMVDAILAQAPTAVPPDTHALWLIVERAEALLQGETASA